jgi:sugar phosphate isomerase/epimerase
MDKMKSGLTGFIPKDADVYATLESYAKMGYKGCSHSWIIFREGDPAENLKRVRGMGLEFVTLGTSIIAEQKPVVADLVKRARFLGVDSVTAYHSSATAWRFADRPELPDYAESMREIELMNSLAESLAKEGLSFRFHNHDQEFVTCYNGVPLFWLMAANVPKLNFEIDLGWAHYAGMNVPHLIRQLGSRVQSLHVKDYTKGDNFEYKPSRTVRVPRYCAPGTGYVDLQGCFEAAVEVGCPWAVIEQDMQYHLTHAESVQCAYLIMKETGLVE